ncbi:MAG: hypothetical protein QOH34_2092, partial [Mycobacterium sp.]|nr:hypothetical protein [Mycobacterium sp.]
HTAWVIIAGRFQMWELPVPHRPGMPTHADKTEELA